MTRVLLLALLGGCNQLYGLERTKLVDGDDGDGDGVFDADDNCPTIGNSDQSDDDLDQVGDVCDNCPVIANHDQTRDADGDGVGDACDPRPDVAGDCLVLYDTFGSDFTSHWQPFSSGAIVYAVTVQDGQTSVTADVRTLFAALGDDGQLLDGTFDVQLRGDFPAAAFGAELQVRSNIASTNTGYGCGFTRETANVLIAYVGQGGNGRVLFSPTIRSDVTLRLGSPLVAGDELTCRGEWGVAAEHDTAAPAIMVGAGPGFAVARGTAALAGIVAYRFQPGVACAPPIIR